MVIYYTQGGVFMWAQRIMLPVVRIFSAGLFWPKVNFKHLTVVLLTLCSLTAIKDWLFTQQSFPHSFILPKFLSHQPQQRPSAASVCFGSGLECVSNSAPYSESADRQGAVQDGSVSGFVVWWCHCWATAEPRSDLSTLDRKMYLKSYRKAHLRFTSAPQSSLCSLTTDSLPKFYDFSCFLKEGVLCHSSLTWFTALKKSLLLILVF